MIICINTEPVGVPTTIGALGNRLGTYLHVTSDSPIHPDGRRQRDQAPHIANIGALAAHIARVRKRREQLLREYEHHLAAAIEKTRSARWRKWSQSRADHLNEFAAKQLEAAINRISVASADLQVGPEDVVWLLAYGQMLDQDESTDMEFSKDREADSV